MFVKFLERDNRLLNIMVLDLKKELHEYKDFFNQYKKKISRIEHVLFNIGLENLNDTINR